MKEFQEGDILIVPKVPDNYHFALYRVKFKEGKAYIFDTSWDNGGLKGSNNKMTNDYRHVVLWSTLGMFHIEVLKKVVLSQQALLPADPQSIQFIHKKLLMLLRKSLKIWSIILSFILVKRYFGYCESI